MSKAPSPHPATAAPVLESPAADRPTAATTARPFAPAFAVLCVCGLGATASIRDHWTTTDDGASMVPLVALLAIAIASLRWRPAPGTGPTRPVSPELARGVNLAAAALASLAVAHPEWAGWLIGPSLSLALLGCYLSLWGYRALALLRTVTLFSILTWMPVAGFVHTVIRASLEQPSDLLYRRLAQLPILTMEGEPWRLFSAQLHRGALVVIATLALGIGANRWRMTPRSLADLTVATALALVAHHLVILLTPIDQYDPSEVTQLATNPSVELAIASLAVTALGLRRLRQRRTERRSAAPTASDADDRDPVIFDSETRRVPLSTTALLLTSLIPLISIAVLSS